LILVTQLFSLGITPLIGYAIGSLLLLSSSFDPFLAKGLMAACSTPTTISSNVLMTRQAKGNEAAALTNAVIGNVLGVFISPLWMIALIGAGNGGTVNYGSIFFQLAVTVVVPFIVGELSFSFMSKLGQLCQVLFPKTVQKLVQHVPLAIVNSCFLLIMVWSVFCDTFSNEQIKSVQSLSIFYILLLDIALYCLFSVGVFYLSRIPWFKLEKEDIVTIQFTHGIGSHCLLWCYKNSCSWNSHSEHYLWAIT
jgi:sodium/bile acid cotransporter 7